MKCDIPPENDNCLSSPPGSISHANCSCTPCKTDVFTTSSTNKFLPLLSQKIFSCYEYNNTVNILGFNAPFQIIQNPNFSYSNGDQICIEDISYSYNTVGTTDSFQFFLNGNLYTFNPRNAFSSPCRLDVLGIIGQADVDAAIASANETIALADAIDTSQPILTQLNQLAAVARNSSETNILASQTITELAETFYPESTRTSLQSALILILEALTAHDEAQQVVANILPTPSSATITSAASSELVPLNQSNSLIEQAASIILNYTPTPSSTILNFANNAINYAQQSSEALQTSINNPPITFQELIVPLITASDALESIVDSLGLLGETTEGTPFITLLESLALQITAVFNSHLGIEAAYDAYNSNLLGDTAGAQNYINLSIGYFILSSQLIIQALTFTNTLVDISIYNEFQSGNIKQNCCNSLFFQLSPPLSVCNLKITLTGTIGNCPFTAIYSNPNDFPLAIAGYTPTDFGFYVCTPYNERFKLYELMNNTFSINCIIPNGPYDSSTPNTIFASTFSTVSQKVELLVITETPLPTLVNDSIVFEQENNTCE